MDDLNKKASSTYPRYNMLWKDIPVGALLYIRADENIPADCLLLCSGNDDGSAFVETANIDGETNLKPKMAPMVTQSQLTYVDSLLLNFIFARSFRIGTLSSSSFFRLSMHGVANLASIST